MRPRRIAALVLTALLAIGVLGATRSGEQSNDESAAPQGPVIASSSASAPSAAASLIVATSGVAAAGIEEDGPDPVTVIRQALSAWGRFAVSRDLAEVEPWFVVDGPQYEQFRTEAGVPGSAGGAAYRVTFEPLAADPVDPNRMRGRVVFVRTGEPSQVFDWWIVLRRRDGRLQVWTVEAADEQ
jgi:hypothetical protein